MGEFFLATLGAGCVFFFFFLRDIFDTFLLLFFLLGSWVPVHCYDWRFVYRPLLFVPVILTTHGHPRSDALFAFRLSLFLVVFFLF